MKTVLSVFFGNRDETYGMSMLWHDMILDLQER
jgi:hypothetical protein